MAPGPARFDNAGTLELRQALAGEGHFAPDSFPGLEIDVAQLWTTPAL